MKKALITLKMFIENNFNELFREHFLLKRFVFLAVLIFFQNCSMDDSPKQNNNYLFNNIEDVRNNYDQVGDFFYKQAKYYPGLDENLNMLEPDVKKKFEELIMSESRTSETTYEDLLEELNVLEQENIVSSLHNQLLINYVNELKDLLEDDGFEGDKIVEWANSQEYKVLSNQELSNIEKGLLTTIFSINRNFLKLEKEKYILNDGYKSDEVYRVMNCNVVSRIFCYTATMITWAYKGYTATGGSAIAGGLPGIVIGALVGLNEAIQNCSSCTTSTCERFDALQFEFKCYSFPSDFLRVKGLGGGAISPSQIEWDFYKDNSTANRIHGQFTSINQYDLPGNVITNNNVQTLAIRARSNCAGTIKFSDYIGWYEISQLGVPNYTVLGNTYVTNDIRMYTQNYNLMGTIRSAQNVTSTIELLPPGDGYNATGTVVSNSGKSISILWNSTPGVARLRCIASTPCGTVEQLWHIIVTS